MDITFIVALVAMLLATASTVLHFVAPLTETKFDDDLVEVVDKVKDLFPPAK